MGQVRVLMFQAFKKAPPPLRNPGYATATEGIWKSYSVKVIFNKAQVNIVCTFFLKTFKELFLVSDEIDPRS